MNTRNIVISLCCFFLAIGCGKKNKDLSKTRQTQTLTKQIVQPEVIYGNDDRLEYYEVTDPSLRILTESTVALVQKNSLRPLSGGGFFLSASKYGSTYGLCTSEPYYQQKSAAFCSGFLVGPQLIASAGHCIKTKTDCENTKFLFDYVLVAPHQEKEVFNDNEVFSCARVIQSKIGKDGEDFSLIQLDRPVTDRWPLAMSQQKELLAGDEIFVVGHPAGLPLKMAGGARVRSVQGEYYTANLDTYGGNSGSAVFNARTREVEGILVRGDNDFVNQNGCFVSNICKNDECLGEDFTKIRHIVNAIPVGEFF